MKRFATWSLAFAGVWLSGCIQFQPKPAVSASPPPNLVVTPDNSLTGKVVSYNSVGRFVVLNISSPWMPKTGQRLFLYRTGLKVAELEVTGPQNEDNIVADLVSGDAQNGDEVRDH